MTEGQQTLIRQYWRISREENAPWWKAVLLAPVYLTIAWFLSGEIQRHNEREAARKRRIQQEERWREEVRDRD